VSVLRSTKKAGRVPVFSIYSSESDEVLVLMVGSEVALFYMDVDGNPVDDNLIAFPGVSTDDLEYFNLNL
jgi:collagen type V/XI/XXIV/XXVII alpha